MKQKGLSFISLFILQGAKAPLPDIDPDIDPCSTTLSAA